MKCLVLGSGRFANMKHSVVSRLRGSKKSLSGSGNAGHGAYVKKDLELGAGLVKKKLIPLKFKM